jgi:hypothetical protein
MTAEQVVARLKKSRLDLTGAEFGMKSEASGWKSRKKHRKTKAMHFHNLTDSDIETVEAELVLGGGSYETVKPAVAKEGTLTWQAVQVRRGQNGFFTSDLSCCCPGHNTVPVPDVLRCDHAGRVAPWRQQTLVPKGGGVEDISESDLNQDEVVGQAMDLNDGDWVALCISDAAHAEEHTYWLMQLVGDSYEVRGRQVQRDSTGISPESGRRMKAGTVMMTGHFGEYAAGTDISLRQYRLEKQDNLAQMPVEFEGERELLGVVRMDKVSEGVWHVPLDQHVALSEKCGVAVDEESPAAAAKQSTKRKKASAKKKKKKASAKKQK